MNIFLRFKHAIGIWWHYYVKPDPSKLGYFGDGAELGIPADLKKPENVYLYEFARLGRRSTIMSVGASKFIMKRGCLTAENLTVITSNHRQKMGSFLAGDNKDNSYGDVVVNEDVWIGANVTILSGVNIGRGAIIGACSVVVKDIPPYSVAVGNPAKVVKFKWSVDEILEHEKSLYLAEDRFSREQLEVMRNIF
jgi:hypothetical protein